MISSEFRSRGCQWGQLRARIVARLLVTAAALCCHFATPAAAQQSLSKQEVQRFKQRVSEGKRLFQLEKYRAAIEQFQAARAVVDHPRLTFNIAQAHRALGECTAARTAFERYIDNPRSKPNMRASAKKLIKKLDASCVETGRLEVSCSPKKADVQLVRLGEDGSQTKALAGTCPINTEIRVGRYRIEARADGHKPGRKVVQIELNSTQAMHLALSRTDTGGAEGLDTNDVIAYSAMGVGAATLVGGFLSDYGSVSRMEALADAQANADAQRIATLRQEADSASTRTAVLYGVGTALVAGGLVWKFVYADAEAPAQTAKVSVEVGPTGVSTRLDW